MIELSDLSGEPGFDDKFISINLEFIDTNIKVRYFEILENKNYVKRHLIVVIMILKFLYLDFYACF